MSGARLRASERCSSVEVVLFDVFGTLVDYERDVATLTYPSTHGLLTAWGLPGSHDEFVGLWSSAAGLLEERALVDHREYGMHDVVAEFAERGAVALTPQQQAHLVASFMTEWKLGIRPIARVPDMIRRLSRQYRLGVVSNTHDPLMVPELLDQLGVLDAFDVVVLSIDHGHRKPHPSIYAAAIDAFGGPPSRIAFVGDTVDADFDGPIRAGMDAWLVDPLDVAGVDPIRRLDHVLDIEARLRHDRA